MGPCKMLSLWSCVWQHRARRQSVHNPWWKTLAVLTGSSQTFRHCTGGNFFASTSIQLVRFCTSAVKKLLFPPYPAGHSEGNFKQVCMCVRECVYDKQVMCPLASIYKPHLHWSQHSCRLTLALLSHDWACILHTYSLGHTGHEGEGKHRKPARSLTTEKKLKYKQSFPVISAYHDTV